MRQFLTWHGRLAHAFNNARAGRPCHMQKQTPMSTRSKLTCLALLLLSSSALAQNPNAEPDPAPDPEKERQSFKVADGFEVTLFAADPLINKPINMCFDARGRLWVVTSSVYPQIKPGEVANDKVVVLEDADGDGKAEAGKVFAENLIIPTGIEVGDGGVYVGNSTELLHFKDTDNDGKADVRKVVLSGFGTEDTHHMIHNLRWAPDGQLHFNQSIYIHSYVETPHGPRKLTGSGTWRFRPATMELEVFTRGLVNPWGQAWDEYGQSFATDGAGSDGISVYLPGSAHGSWGTEAKRWLTGLNPGHPKYCGVEYVSGRHLPADWQGNLIANDFRANRVVRFQIQPEGSGYTSKLMQPDVIKSSDKAFRPVDVKMGPDGAIYIADWYNPIINHGEVDFRDPRRDRVHGRIWRITAKNRPLVQKPKIAGAPLDVLVDMLTSPESYTRHMARRELASRKPADVAAQVKSWVRQRDKVDSEKQLYLLEALWTLQAVDVFDTDLLQRILRAPDPQLRAAGTRALYFALARVPGYRLNVPTETVLAWLGKLVADENPKVRLEAVIALGQINDPAAANLAMSALDRPLDRMLEYGLYLTTLRLKDVWFPQVQAGKVPFNGNTRHLAFALDALGSEEALKPLMALISSAQIAPQQAESLIPLVTQFGGPGELRELWTWSAKQSDAHLAKTLSALTSAARTRKLKPSGNLAEIEKLFSHASTPLRASAIRLAGAWKLETAKPRIAELATAKDTPAPVRSAAVEALGDLGDKQTLIALASTGPDTSLRMTAIGAMTAIDLDAAATQAAAFLESAPGDLDPAPMISTFLQRNEGGVKLANALAGKKLSPDGAKLALRYLYSTGRKEAGLEEILRTAATVKSEWSDVSTPEHLKTVAAEVMQKGDAARGEKVFRSATVACFTCHALGGAGGQLGPDLSAAGSASPIEYLVESILLPAKNVKEGFGALAVTTKDGDFFSGILVAQNDKEMVLRDAITAQITIPLKDIKSRKNAGSMMPTGLADLLTRQEFLDLIKFLSTLGTPANDTNAHPTVVRRWQTLTEPTWPLPQPSADDSALAWSPIYATVTGQVPLMELPKVQGHSVLRCEVEVTTAGPVVLKLDGADGIKLFIDGKPISASPQSPIELTQGVHAITAHVDSTSRQSPLRLWISESPNSPARLRIVGGR